jgi:branched-chain amino acid transport system ATP-binding protein
MEGLAPIIVEEIERAIHRMTRDEGTTVILVEQHADIALALTSQAIVLERGVIVHRSSSSELLKDEAMLDRFIGLKLKEA